MLLVLFVAAALGFMLTLGKAAAYGLALGLAAAWTMPPQNEVDGWPSNLVTLALCVVLASAGSFVGSRYGADQGKPA